MKYSVPEMYIYINFTMTYLSSVDYESCYRRPYRHGCQSFCMPDTGICLGARSG